MTDWNPALYLAHAGPRLRPALDLLNRIDAAAPADVCDLGCGTGTATRLLAARWPQARIVGIDSSPAMLAQAAAESPPGDRLTWRQADLSSWSPPPASADVVFSNAALHWLDDHATLLPRLMAALRPGGVLAVQMPDNFAAPSHQALFALARDARWADRLVPLLREAPVARPAEYRRLLAPLAADLDIWTTEYLHLLDGPDPVLTWTGSTILRPLLDRLDPAEAKDLAAAYGAALRAAYPADADGRTPFPFRRLFLVAVAA
ncbi:methyltransferase domain-containing protein [Caenispirillum bisanense]|uniref:methyltransferase domain-containing protein n=1 Tax=Caenispirillum bisanense TaxID=414052 RepID=UPI0031D98DE6